MKANKQLNLFGEKPEEYLLTLALTIKWFDMIESDIKLAEYRKMSKMLRWRLNYIGFGTNSRLVMKFNRGYRKTNIVKRCYAITYYKDGKIAKHIPYKDFEGCEPVPLVEEWGAPEDFTGLAFGLVKGTAELPK